MKLSTIVLLLVTGWPVFGVAETVTLEQAVQHTMRENFGLRSAAQAIQTAQAQTQVAESARDPQIALRYSMLASDNPLDAFAERLNTRSVRLQDFEPDRLNNPEISTLFRGGVVLNYPVYTGGRTRAEIDRAEGNTELARMNYERTRQRVAFNTIRAYYAAQAAERGVRIAQDAEAAAKRHARTTRRLVREDRTVKSDQLTAEVNLSAFKGQTIRVMTHAKLAYNGLKVAMGMVQQSAVSVLPMEMGPLPADRRGVEALEQFSLSARFDLKALQAAAVAARAAVRAAEAGLKPSVDLLADASLYEDHPLVNEYSWRVFGVVRKDLYTGGRTRAEVAAARSYVETIDFQIESLRQAVLRQVRDAYDSIHESRGRLEIAQGNVAKARRNVALIEERYGQGRTLLIDLLGAEQRLVEARNEELDARLSLSTSVAALHLADGSLNPDDVSALQGGVL